MFLAENICFLVLAFEMEYINRENDLLKKSVPLLAKMLLQTTVIVEEDSIREILTSEIVNRLEPVLFGFKLAKQLVERVGFY